MILEAIQIGLLIYAGYKYLTRPKPPKPPGAEPFDESSIPRNQEGKPIPMFWGTVRVRAPILAHFFAFQSAKRPPIDGIESYQYAACMLFILGIPPKQCELSVLTKFYIGEQCLNDIPPGGVEPGFEPLAAGTVGALSFVDTFIGHSADDTSSTAEIIRGYCEFSDGTVDWSGSEFQVAYADAGFDATLLPSYKGMMRVALSGAPTVTDPVIGRAWWFGKKPSIDGYSFEVATQPFLFEGSAPEYYKTAGLFGGINPIGALHDLITTKWGKIGLPESRLDLTTFEDAAAILNTEGHGFSLIVYDAVDAKEIIKEISQEIDGVVYEDPTTRKISVKLIREDYDVGSIPLFDDVINDNVISVLRFETGSWADTYNQVRVTFNDREKDYTPQTAVAQDTANIAAQGRLRTLELNYPGITHAALASRVASRELRAVSTPLKKVRLAVNRDGYSLRPGAVIKWSCAKYNITNMILRVGDCDFGELDDNRVLLECVQDRFAVNYSIYVPPDEFNFPPPARLVPPPVMDRLEQEAPRFVQERAASAVSIDPTLQHMWHLATPNIGDGSFRGFVSGPVTLGLTLQDAPERIFPVRARVETSYANTVGPYDTGTGLRIKDVSATLAAQVAADIAAYGYNVILVGNDADTAELMAFETITDLGGEVIRLNNVWRDILDTARQTHAVDERVTFISQSGWAIDGARVGTFTHGLAASVTTKIVPRSHHTYTLDPSLIDGIAHTVRKRIDLPFPGCDYQLNTSRAIAELAEEGMRATWKRRNYLSPSIVRSDAATEAVSSTMRHRTYATKVGVDGTEFPEVNVTPGTEINGVAVNYVPLGEAGHGDIDVRLRSVDGSASSWQDPTIRVVAPHWRNLLLNPRFADNPGGEGSSFLSQWTTVGGGSTPGTGNTGAEALGGTGRYLNWASNTGEIRQDVPIYPGFGDSERLIARLRFYGHNLAAGTSILKVYLETLDVSDAVIDTIDTGDLVPSNSEWERYELELPIAAGTRSLRVRITTDAAVEIDPSATAATEFWLDMGDSTANLLSNPGFESALTDWTVGAGAWTHSIGPGYTDSFYSRGNGGAATAELYQQVAVETGHEANSTAVFDCAVARDGSDADDTGEIIIEARDAAGTTVLASATSGSFGPSLGNLIWERKRVTLELPPDTGEVRVRLRATYVTDSSVQNIAYDDCDLHLHKHLAPAGVIDAVIASPLPQPMPAGWARWWQDFQLPAPNYGHWNGASFASVAPQVAPTMTDGGVESVSEFVGGYYGGVHVLADCYEFTGDLSSVDVQRYANFGRAQRWACGVFFRVDPRGFSGGCGITGRRGVNRGWALDVRSSGVIRASVFGAAATVNVDSAASVVDGRLHLAIIYWDGTDVRLQLDGVETTGSGASCGEFGTTFSDPCSFRIGRAREADTVFAGQIARVMLWYGVDNMPTAAQALTLWTHGGDPTGEAILQAGVGIAAAQLASVEVLATGGETRVVRYGAGQFPVGYHATPDKWGLAMSGGVTNWANSDFTDGAKWGTSGSPTITQNLRDIDGFTHAVRILGAGSDYLRALALTLSATADVRVSFYARSITGGSHAIKVELRNTSGTMIGSAVTPTVNTGTWQRVDVNFTWDDSTANGEIWIAAGAITSSIEISGPVVVHQSGAFWPMLLPVASVPTSLSNVGYRMDDAQAVIGAAAFYDGEMFVQGFCPHAPTYAANIANVGKPDTTFQNRRILDTNSSADALFLLYDGDAVPSGVTSEVSPSDAEWVDTWTVRARWSRARLINDTSGLTFATLFGALYFGIGEAPVEPDYADNDVTSIFTVEAGNDLSAELGDLRTYGVLKPINALIHRWWVSAREEERFPVF